MAEKILQTRIALKIDTLENWENSSLALKKGELAIAVIEPTETNGLAEAVTMIKIGEGGDKTFKDLTWNFHAKAADVVAAAKSNDALTAFVANVIANSGMASDEAMEALVDRMTDAEGAIEVLNGAADVEGSVAKSIADAIAALALADTYVAKEEGKSLIADTEIARLAAMSDGANKVEASETNGNIKIDGEEVVVYTHPEKHAIADVTGLQDALDGLQAKGDYAAEEHTHTKAEITDFAHTHEMGEVNGLVDALAGKETAGEAAKVQAALEAYQGTNDAAVKKVADDLAAEAAAARAAEKVNSDAIVAIKDHESVDSFADVMAEIAKKQDIIPAETYDAYGAAAQTLTDAKAYTDALAEEVGNTASGIGVRLTNLETNSATKAELTAHETAANAAIAAAKQAGDDAMAEAQKKVASVTAADNSVTIAGTSTAPTVAAKLSADADNALTLAADGLKVVIPAAAEYSIVKAADSGDYAAVYNLTKDGTIVGASINIPKDIVVKSGSVVGDEIVLVLNDESATEIKIPVGSLIEYVTSGSATGDMVVVNVSDDHKVTATITDGSITLAKLTTEVQTAIGKAHVHENADVLAGINADKVAQWDAAEVNAQADWNVNDETSDAYIQNRPFYEVEGEYELIFDKAITAEEFEGHPQTDYYSYELSDFEHRMVHGDTYKIVWDGQIYELQCRQKDSYTLAVVTVFPEGNDYMDYEVNPFVILNTTYGGNYLKINIGEQAAHTVQIYHATTPSTLKQLDEKFIPDTIARVADTDAALAAAKTELEGKIADASDNAKSYIDSNVETLEMADAGLNTRIEALEAKFGEGEGSVEEMIAAAKEEALNQDAVVLAEAQKGIDAVQANLDAADAAMNTRVEALEAMDHEQVQGDWAQNDETAKDYIKNRPFYEETNETVLYSGAVIVQNTYEDGTCYATFDRQFNLDVNKKYTVTYNNEVYILTPTVVNFGSDFIILGNPYVAVGADIPFGIGQDVAMQYNADLTAVATGQTELQIEIIGDNSIVHKIDDKFLPDVSWDQLENKPFYSEKSYGQVLLEETSYNVEEYNSYDDSYQIASIELSYSAAQMNQKWFEVVVDGTAYDVQYVRVYSDNGYWGVNNFSESNDYPFSIWTEYGGKTIRLSFKTQGLHTVKITELSGPVNIKHIDDQFISDNIARVSDVNTAISRISDVEARMDTVEAFMGDGEGSVADQIADAKAEILSEVDAAIANQHKHENLAELDKFVDGDKAKLDAAVQTVTAGPGLIATRSGADVAIAFDDSIVFVFDCGDSTGSTTVTPSAEGESF